jgi:hypothetical protein
MHFASDVVARYVSSNACFMGCILSAKLIRRGHITESS